MRLIIKLKQYFFDNLKYKEKITATVIEDVQHFNVH